MSESGQSVCAGGMTDIENVLDGVGFGVYKIMPMDSRFAIGGGFEEGG